MCFVLENQNQLKKRNRSVLADPVLTLTVALHYHLALVTPPASELHSCLTFSDLTPPRSPPIPQPIPPQGPLHHPAITVDLPWGFPSASSILTLYLILKATRGLILTSHC